MFIGVELGGICKEYKNYKFLVDGIGNEITKKRADESLKYFLERATLFKGLSSAFAGAAIALPIIATFAASSVVTASDLIIPIITAFTAFFSGFQALFKYNDKKVTYRNYAETLKSELYSYHSKINDYSTSSDEKREKILADRINKLIKESNAKISTLESDNSSNNIDESELEERILKVLQQKDVGFKLEEEKTESKNSNEDSTDDDSVAF